MTVRAVLIDLDDTIYPQQQYLDAAWRQVAAVAGRLGHDEEEVYRALTEIAALGSDRGRIIDRALARCAGPGVAVGPLVDAFRSFRPTNLSPYPGSRAALRALHQRMSLALVTDGDVKIQRAKIGALRIKRDFDAVIISDARGRDFRKPHSHPFLAALEALDVRPEESVMVGDRPDKDVAGAAALGIPTIRVLTGEYAAAPDGPVATLTAPSLAMASQSILCGQLEAVITAAGIPTP